MNFNIELYLKAQDSNSSREFDLARIYVSKQNWVKKYENVYNNLTMIKHEQNKSYYLICYRLARPANVSVTCEIKSSKLMSQ